MPTDRLAHHLTEGVTASRRSSDYSVAAGATADIAPLPLRLIKSEASMMIPKVASECLP